MKAEIRSKQDYDNRNQLQDVIPLDTPYVLYVDPSSVCNFRCKFCPTGHESLVKNAGYDRSILDFELFKKAMDELQEFPEPLKVLRLQKIGEPLLNPNYAKMIKYAKNTGRVERIDTTTNAWFLTEQTAREIIDAGLDKINISIEGVNSKQYKEISGVDIDFDRIVRQVAFLYEHKKQCEITVKIPGNYLSEEDKKRFFDLFGDICDRIFVEELGPEWPNFDIESIEDLHIKDKVGQFEKEWVERKSCTLIFFSMVLNSDGTVSPCVQDWGEDMLIGDERTQTLKEIWNSDKLRKLQILHLCGNRKQSSVCRTCQNAAFSQIDNIDDYTAEILKRLQ